MSLDISEYEIIILFLTAVIVYYLFLSHSERFNNRSGFAKEHTRTRPPPSQVPDSTPAPTQESSSQ
jgi:hypothetical protein